MAEAKTFRATSWPRERFYISRDQRRSASVAPHSWESDEPVADAVRERWRIHKQTHHGFMVTLRLKFTGDWRTRVTQPVRELTEACRIAQAWVRDAGHDVAESEAS